MSISKIKRKAIILEENSIVKYLWKLERKEKKDKKIISWFVNKIKEIWRQSHEKARKYSDRKGW